MADRISEDRRSWNMSRIRSRDTKPELILRSALHRAGFRFRLRSDLPGKPDLVLPRYRTAVFVHGCFWHRHKRCQFAYMPKSRVTFWQDKFDANVSRDQRAQDTLRRLGWTVIIVWECELRRDVPGTLDRVRSTLESRQR
jgi:DNA mismatch endonuclease, patch repair protein